jgi:SAM-dependent methyltransferase
VEIEMSRWQAFGPPDYSLESNFLAPSRGPWSLFLFLHRKPILESLVTASENLTGHLLDVGCGNKPYAKILKCDRHTGIDIDSTPHSKNAADVIFDGKTLPFEDGQFDSLLCTEVLEHVRELDDLLSELGRVLKPGAHGFITVPMVIHHHEEPYDYRRLTRFGMSLLADKMGCEVVWITSRGGIYTVLASFLLLSATYTLSIRPIIDILLVILWPFCMFLLLVERLRGREPVISLGWQMLVKKKT